MSEPWQELAAAIHADDADSVASILARHAELAPRLDDELPDGSFGATALLTAVHNGNRRLIEVLLEAGADINVRSHWWAGGFGVLEHDGGLEQFLIERGAYVDACAAARLGMGDRLAELIAADPSSVSMRGGDGKMPLHWAASIPIADLLLDSGADINARDIDHEFTAAQHLVRDKPEVARHLVARGSETDVLMLSALGEIDRVRAVLDADPESIGLTVAERNFPMTNPRAGGTIYIWTLGVGKSPHGLAHEFGHQALLALLMARTPPELKLAVACELGDARLVDRLLSQHGPLAPAPSALQERLVDAARNNAAETVRLMLAGGWPASGHGREGTTALHWAGFHGNAVMTAALVAAGADLASPDTVHGGTPLGWAIHGSVHGWYCKTGNYAAVVDAMLGAGAAPPDHVGGSAEVQDVLRRRGG